MQFEWDESKNQSNIEKHGLSFEYAKELFAQDLWVISDKRFDYEEYRYIGYGKIESRLMCVVYAERFPDKIRIISFRKANKREQELFKKNRLEKG